MKLSQKAIFLFPARFPRDPKEVPRGPKETPNSTQEAPGRAKQDPRGSQELKGPAVGTKFSSPRPCGDEYFVPTALWWPKIAPRWPKNAPRNPKTADPRPAQDRPKMAQDRTKAAPRAPQESPQNEGRKTKRTGDNQATANGQRPRTKKQQRKRSPWRPKTPQVGPKRCPGCSQETSKRLPRSCGVRKLINDIGFVDFHKNHKTHVIYFLRETRMFCVNSQHQQALVMPPKKPPRGPQDGPRWSQDDPPKGCPRKS